jgi:hypothetical protein
MMNSRKNNFGDCYLLPFYSPFSVLYGEPRQVIECTGNILKGITGTAHTLRLISRND